jgi:hypothetical protein
MIIYTIIIKTREKKFDNNQRIFKNALFIVRFIRSSNFWRLMIFCCKRFNSLMTSFESKIIYLIIKLTMTRNMKTTMINSEKKNIKMLMKTLIIKSKTKRDDLTKMTLISINVFIIRIKMYQNEIKIKWKNKKNVRKIKTITNLFRIQIRTHFFK